MIIKKGDIFEGNHDMIAFGVNMYANDAGFCRVVINKYGLLNNELTVAVQGSSVGSFIMSGKIFSEGLPNPALLVIHEYPGTTRPEDIEACLHSLISSRLHSGTEGVGMVALGCGPLGGLPGGFKVLVELCKKAGFNGTLYEPK